MDDTFPPRRAYVGLALTALAYLLVGPVGCAQYIGKAASSVGDVASQFAANLPGADYIGTTARSFLNIIQNDPDPNVRYLAYSKLASPQCYDSVDRKAEAVKVLVEKLGGSREPIASRAVICRTLGVLGDASARDALIAAISDSEGLVRVQACRALGKVGKTEDATILARIMAVDMLEDCRIAAIESLGELKSKDARILQMLVAGMEHDDPAIRLASLKALRNITGLDRGVEATARRDSVLPQTAAASPNAAAASSSSTPPSNTTRR